MDTVHNQLRAIGGLVLAGSLSYLLCAHWHVCMAGHMQHGPYPLVQWVSDCWWVLCFVSAFVLSLRVLASMRLLLLVGSFLLTISRLFLGDNTLIEFPLLVAMVVCAAGYLAAPARFASVGVSMPAVGDPSVHHLTQRR